MKSIILILSLMFLFSGISYAIDADGYDTVTLSKSKEIPTPFCPVTKISDNNDCMDCHAMLIDKEGNPKFGLKELPLDANYAEKPSSLEIVMHNGEIVGRYLITGTGSYVMRDIADYFYTRPELKRLVIELQTPGGSVMDAWRAVGIIEEMRTHGIVIEVRCYGLAASAGVILLVSGNIGERYVNPHAEIMIHKVWTFAMFDFKTPDTAEDQAQTLKHFQENINSYLIGRSNMTAQSLEECIYKKDFWMTGSEAVEFGLADKFIK